MPLIPLFGQRMPYPFPLATTFADFSAMKDPAGNCVLVAPVTNMGPAADCTVQFGFLVQEVPFGPITAVYDTEIHTSDGPVVPDEPQDFMTIVALPPKAYGGFAKIVFTLNGKTYTYYPKRGIVGL